MSPSHLSNTAVATKQCSCGGACENRNISFTLRRSATAFVMFQNVPAEVCSLCGEPQFSLATSEKMMVMLHTRSNPDSVIVIPVYDLATA